MTILEDMKSQKEELRNNFFLNSEKYYVDEYGNKIPFPSLCDKPLIDISVIIPAYNEENRLPSMLQECIEYIQNEMKKNIFKYEIIIVDDGSKDKTYKIAQQQVKKYGSGFIRVLKEEFNRGKGGAVRLGVMSCRGKYILFADADGATKFSELDKLTAVLKNMISGTNKIPETAWKMPALVVGSRAHLEKDSISKRSLFRTLLMYCFHFLVWLFCVRTVKDTQCGFKLMTRAAAHILFFNLHLERWAFDVELLYLAEKLYIPLEEVSVIWEEIEGSKLTPLFSWIQMGYDLFYIWLMYSFGIWKIETNAKDCSFM